MTAPTQMPSEPDIKCMFKDEAFGALKDYASALRAHAESLQDLTQQQESARRQLQAELEDARKSVESLQAECKRQKKISLQIMEAADRKVEQAERKLAEAVAALREIVNEPQRAYFIALKAINEVTK